MQTHGCNPFIRKLGRAKRGDGLVGNYFLDVRIRVVAIQMQYKWSTTPHESLIYYFRLLAYNQHASIRFLRLLSLLFHNYHLRIPHGLDIKQIRNDNSFRRGILAKHVAGS